MLVPGLTALRHWLSHVKALVQQTVDRFGRLDCAFNNAATIEVGMFRPTPQYTEAEYEQAMSLNLKSVWLCLKYELEQMLLQGTGGAIVNTSSVNGLGGVPGGALYAAAKAGVLALTKSTAQEYGGNGIRVNALVAGGFRTPMLEGVFQTIRGRVQNEVSGEKLAGAAVLLTDVQCAVGTATRSGIDGSFVLRTSAGDTVRLRVERPGYAGVDTQPWVLNRGSTLELQLRLRPAPLCERRAATFCRDSQDSHGSGRDGARAKAWSGPERRSHLPAALLH